MAEISDAERPVIGAGLSFDGTTLSNNLVKTVGADPRTGGGQAAALGTFAFDGTNYYWKFGAGNNDWFLFVEDGAVAVRGKLALGGNSTDIAIPVAGGNGNGRIRAAGLIIGDAGVSVVSHRINGSATNCVMSRIFGAGGGVSHANDQLFNADGSGSAFEFTFETKALGGAVSRQGHGRASTDDSQGVWAFSMFFHDAATAITDITLHSSIANGFKTGSYVTYEEVRT